MSLFLFWRWWCIVNVVQQIAHVAYAGFPDAPRMAVPLTALTPSSNVAVTSSDVLVQNKGTATPFTRYNRVGSDQAVWAYNISNAIFNSSSPASFPLWRHLVMDEVDHVVYLAGDAPPYEWLFQLPPLTTNVSAPWTPILAKYDLMGDQAIWIRRYNDDAQWSHTGIGERVLLDRQRGVVYLTGYTFTTFNQRAEYPERDLLVGQWSTLTGQQNWRRRIGGDRDEPGRGCDTMAIMIHPASGDLLLASSSESDNLTLDTGASGVGSIESTRRPSQYPLNFATAFLLRLSWQTGVSVSLAWLNLDPRLFYNTGDCIQQFVTTPDDSIFIGASVDRTLQRDVVVARLSQDLTRLDWTTRLDGQSTDLLGRVHWTVESTGQTRLWIWGQTASPTFQSVPIISPSLYDIFHVVMDPDTGVPLDVTIYGTTGQDLFYSANDNVNDHGLWFIGSSPAELLTPGQSMSGGFLSVYPRCGPGQWSPGITARCRPCSSGRYSNSTGFKSNDCTECPPGTWQSQPGATSCRPCPRGTWSDVSGGTLAAGCVYCPVGRANPDERQAMESSCASCGPGTYAPSIGLAVCLSCGPGTYQPTEGAFAVDHCLSCPVGTYQPLIGVANRTQCLDCPSGTYQSRVASTSCIVCPVGRYQPQVAAGDSNLCIACPVGRYQPLENATSIADCQICGPGTYQPQVASTGCLNCPAGTYQSQYGADSSCTSCPAGRFQPNSNGNATSLAACAVCPSGTYQPGLGQVTCTECPAGTYQDRQGATTNDCIACPADTFNPTTRSTNVSACLACPTGRTTGGVVGSTHFSQCAGSQCEPGSEGVTSEQCRPCPVGTASRGNGQLCLACRMGFYQDKGGQSTCIPCPSTTYQDQIGQTVCKSCGGVSTYCPMASISSQWTQTTVDDILRHPLLPASSSSLTPEDEMQNRTFSALQRVSIKSHEDDFEVLSEQVQLVIALVLVGLILLVLILYCLLPCHNLGRWTLWFDALRSPKAPHQALVEQHTDLSAMFFTLAIAATFTVVIGTVVVSVRTNTLSTEALVPVQHAERIQGKVSVNLTWLDVSPRDCARLQVSIPDVSTTSIRQWQTMYESKSLSANTTSWCQWSIDYVLLALNPSIRLRATLSAPDVFPKAMQLSVDIDSGHLDRPHRFVARLVPGVDRMLTGISTTKLDVMPVVSFSDGTASVQSIESTGFFPPGTLTVQPNQMSAEEYSSNQQQQQQPELQTNVIGLEWECTIQSLMVSMTQVQRQTWSQITAIVFTLVVTIINVLQRLFHYLDRKGVHTPRHLCRFVYHLAVCCLCTRVKAPLQRWSEGPGPSQSSPPPPEDADVASSERTWSLRPDATVAGGVFSTPAPTQDKTQEQSERSSYPVHSRQPTGGRRLTWRSAQPPPPIPQDRREGEVEGHETKEAEEAENTHVMIEMQHNPLHDRSMSPPQPVVLDTPHPPLYA